MPKIQEIFAREILDSRGLPTVEVDITLTDSSFGRAAVPSGASVGSNEAIELRDQDNSRFLGKGTLKAVNNVNSLIRANVLGYDFSNQESFDQNLIDLDGTQNKAQIGANAILACSLAFAKASAAQQGIPLFRYIGAGSNLPRPMMNIINGGMHADNNLDIQEFMIVPLNYESSKEAIRTGSEIFQTLKKILKSQGFNTNVGDEGGVAPNFKSSQEALDFIMQAIEKVGYTPGTEVAIALDAAASEFYRSGQYNLKGENAILDSEELVDYYANLINRYPIISLEDPMSEFDSEGWKLITEVLGEKVQIIGDDNFVTNPILLQKGIDQQQANGILIKLNQIGTLTETLKTIELAHNNNYTTIISHRSGETEDTTIAHLAVGSGSWQIKTGAPNRTDRVCKYNELIRIEELL